MTVRSIAGRMVRVLHLQVPVNHAIHAARWVAGTVPRLPWKVRVVRLAMAPPRPERLAGEPSNADVPVVMCLWNRPARIDAVLAMLDDQTADRRVRLVLWCNQPADDLQYRSAVAAFDRKGSLASVEYHASPHNLGGIGRFVAIARLRADGFDGPVITLDDDEDVRPEFVGQLLAAAGPRRIAGWWTFLTGTTYWERLPVPEGHKATYVGTGGAVLDSTIVDDRRFFTRLPARFGFVEDTWMCHVARGLGWFLTKVETEITFVMAEQDQGHAIADMKDQFYAYLRRRERRRAWPFNGATPASDGGA